MALPWAQVAASPQFQALPDDQKEAARQQYFRDVVAPQVPPDQLPVAQAQFNKATWEPKRIPAAESIEAGQRYTRDHNPAMEGIGTAQRLVEGAGKSVADTGLGMRQLYASVADKVAPLPQTVGGLVSGQQPSRSAAMQQEVDQRARQDDALLRTPAGSIGDVAGQAVQMAAPAGDVAKGLSWAGRAAPYIEAATRAGAFAGTQPVLSGDTRAGNVATSAALGAAGQKIAGVAGTVATKAKNAITPEVMRLYQQAQKAGIPVHFSQLSDSKFVKTLASTLSYFPMSGAGKAAKNQQEAFNRAAGRSFGADAATLSDDVMATAKQNLGTAYDKIFAGRTIGLDKQAVQDLFKLHSTVGRDLESSQAKVVKNQIERILDEAGHQGAMPGKVYQSLRSELRNQFGKESPVGRAVMQARKVLDDAAERSLGPAEAAALKKLNAAYANFGTVKDALKQVAGARGDVKPASLYPLVRNGSTKDMRELAKVGQVLLKDPIPDSGTAGRLIATGALGGTGLTGFGLLPLLKLMAVGGTAGRAANSQAATKYIATGNAQTLNGLARLAKGAPFALPAVANAEKKKRP